MNKNTTYSLIPLVLLSLTLGCDKTATDNHHPSPTKPSAHPVSNTTSASAAPSAKANASTTPLPKSNDSVRTWTGTYQSSVAKVHPPEKVHDYTWKNDDHALAIGTGKVTVRLTAHQHLQGEASGALGDQLVSGLMDQTKLRLSWKPKNPHAKTAMTCSGAIDQSKSSWTGTMHCAGPKGIIVRTVQVELKD